MTVAGTTPERAGENRHNGVPGTPLCRDDLPATRHDPHNGAAGQPSRQSVPVHLYQFRCRPPACHRRGRSPSIVLLTTAPMVRRWAAAGEPEGRSSGTRSISHLSARPTASPTRDPYRHETDGQAGRPHNSDRKAGITGRQDHCCPLRLCRHGDPPVPQRQGLPGDRTCLEGVDRRA